MADQGDVTGPNLSVDDCTNKDGTIHGIRGDDVSAIWRPAETPEERMRGVDEGLLDIGFELPIGSSPYFDGSIVGLSGKVLADGVPDDAVDVTLMEVEPFEEEEGGVETVPNEDEIV